MANWNNSAAASYSLRSCNTEPRLLSASAESGRSNQRQPKALLGRVRLIQGPEHAAQVDLSFERPRVVKYRGLQFGECLGQAFLLLQQRPSQ